ncbi:hypothetical protein V6N13_084709 [Hibiscus sabdariffa]|uniref:Uncharacterized protein n=1 Tax=Hibiscus sabdariffa TaxID=183260 RepID=A0ABR2T2G3_9ROSI
MVSELFFSVILLRTREIRNQVYYEDANKVLITVKCCSPEKIRDKLCSKGGGSIKSILIIPPPPPSPPRPTAMPEMPEKKPEKTEEAKKKTEKPREIGDKKAEKSKQAAVEPPKAMEAAPLLPVSYAIGHSYMDGYHHCYGGGGPSFYGGPPQHPFQNYESMGRPVYDSWGGGGGSYYGYGYGGGHTGKYFSDETPQGCSIM